MPGTPAPVSAGPDGPLAPSTAAFRRIADLIADMVELEPHLARDAYDLVATGAWPSRLSAAWEQVLSSGHDQAVAVLRGHAGDDLMRADSPFHALGLIPGEIRLAALHDAYLSAF